VVRQRSHEITGKKQTENGGDAAGGDIEPEQSRVALARNR
jgi:hypothetical protein